MSRYVRRTWESRFDDFGLSKADRKGCSYEAYVPDPLVGRPVLLDGPVAAIVSDAEREIVGFDRSAIALGDTEALARLLLRAEAVGSSRIEGLEIGPRRLLRADAARVAGENSRDVTATEVLANIDAMTYATETIREGTPITVEYLLEIHHRLMVNTGLSAYAGKIRTEQNWIGGSSYNPCSAAFVPPPPKFVEALLRDLCQFCNEDTLQAVAQAAIAHVQFETIHPFVDGNGRVGRALIHAVLRRRGLARRFIPPVSLVLATHSEAYVRGLNGTQYRGSAASEPAIRGSNSWVELFSNACIRSVRDAEVFERRVRNLQREWRARLGAVRSHSVIGKLLDALPGAPILTVKTATELTHRSVPAVNEAIGRLVDAGILRATSAQARNRTFESVEIIEAFTDLERGLATPAGDTRVEPPARRVPERPVKRT